MTNADILMGAVVVLAYVFLLAPCLINGFSHINLSYRESVIAGLVLTSYIAVFVAVSALLIMCIMYFSDAIVADSPAQDFINWVNAL